MPPPPPHHPIVSKGRFLCWFIVDSLSNIQFYYLTNFEPRLMDLTSPTSSVCVTDSSGLCYTVYCIWDVRGMCYQEGRVVRKL